MNVKENEMLAKYSTFHIGGNADFFIEIETKTDLIQAFSFIQKYNHKFLIIGGGSNLVFSDEGFRGVVLFCKNKTIISQHNGEYYAESGTRMMEIFMISKKEGYDFSIFSTIPGTIGGAAAGNAGLPQQEISDVFISAEIYDIEKNIFFSADKQFFNFSYRSTSFHTFEYKNRYIIWSVTIKLPELSSEEIAKKAKKFMKTRKEKQPWGKTGGSFFSNPDEYSAGYLLEKSGLKGFHHNGVFFSEKHANFMMSNETGTQKDILELEHIAKKKVYQEFGILLQREVRCIDEHGELIVTSL